MSQLTSLVQAIPKEWINKAPQGKYGEYVPHFVTVQWLLYHVGPYGWELVELLRGHSEGTVKNQQVAYDDVIVGCVYRMTVTIDGRETVIEEPGSCDAYLMDNDGERLKKAASDALKRCAMRVGVAIQMWCKNPSEFFLPYWLDAAEPAKAAAPTEDVVIGGEADDEAGHTPDIEEYEAAMAGEAMMKQLEDQTAMPGPEFNEDTGELIGHSEGTAIAVADSTKRLEFMLGWEWKDLGRMKCQQECEGLDPYLTDVPCCKSAYVRRMYRLATDAGVAQPREGEQDLLHQALHKAGKKHLADYRSAALDTFIADSHKAFYRMLYEG